MATDFIFQAPLVGASSVFTFTPLQSGIVVLGASVEMLGVSATPTPALSVTSFSQSGVTVGWANYAAGRQTTVKVTVYVSEAVVSGGVQVLPGETVVVAGDLEVLGSTNFDGGLTNFFLDATDYGLSTSASGTVNAAALVVAIAAAGAANKELFIPIGTYLINMHNCSYAGAIKAAIALGASVVIRGAGAELTVLASDGWLEPTYSDPSTILVANDEATALVALQPVSGIVVTLSDLGIMGPPEAGLTHVRSNVWGIYSNGGGSLTLNNVNFSNFNQSMKLSNNYPAYPGTGTRLKISGGYNQFRGGAGILHDGATGSEDYNDQLLCKYRYQNDLTPLISGVFGDARHCLYIANGVSLRTVQNRYLATGGTAGFSGCAWRHYSVEVGGVPLYSESLNEYFDRECAAAIIPNPNFVSTIRGAVVYTRNASGNQAAQLPGTAVFDDCHFIGEIGAGSAISDGAFSGGCAIISNTLFTGDWAYAVGRISASAANWKIGPNVEFRHSSSTGGGGIRNLGGGMDIDGVVFDVKGTGTGGAAFFKGGSVSIANTRFATGCKYMVISADSANLTMRFLSGNSIDDGVAPVIVVVANTLGFSGQWFNTNGYALTGVPAGTLSGSLQTPYGTGGYVYASNRLVLDWAGDTYLINEGGGPTINNINMKGDTAGGAVANDLNAPVQCTVKLYVQQAFTLGNSGNIVAAAGARTAGTVVTLQYLNTLATPKWVEV